MGDNSKNRFSKTFSEPYEYDNKVSTDTSTGEKKIFSAAATPSNEINEIDKAFVKQNEEIDAYKQLKPKRIIIRSTIIHD